MDYRSLLAEVENFADDKYREFQIKLLKNEKINVLGVKIPVLRKIAKKYSGQIDLILSFPDEFFEITFIKLAAAALLEYDELIPRLDYCVKLIDNWASCDGFAPNCIKNRKEEFLPYIKKYAAADGEFERRFALTSLLRYYVEEKYLETIFGLADKSDTSEYYVRTAVAWLVAETLVKFYPRAVKYLTENSLDKKTHNMAIRKACESFRLSADRKNYLKGIRR